MEKKWKIIQLFSTEMTVVEVDEGCLDNMMMAEEVEVRCCKQAIKH